MVNRSMLIGIGILVLVGLGLVFVSTMTGNVITGAVVMENVDDEEYFKISDFGAAGSEVPIDTEVKDGA
jgi:hypothetical protein